MELHRIEVKNPHASVRKMGRNSCVFRSAVSPLTTTNSSRSNASDARPRRFGSSAERTKCAASFKRPNGNFGMNSIIVFKTKPPPPRTIVGPSISAVILERPHRRSSSEKPTIESFRQALVAGGILDKVESKLVDWMAGVGNSAAHNLASFKPGDVEPLYAAMLDFLARFTA